MSSTLLTYQPKSSVFSLTIFTVSLIVLCSNVLLYSTGLIGSAIKTTLRLLSIGLLVIDSVSMGGLVLITRQELLIVGLSSLAFAMGRSDVLNITTIVLIGINARALGRDGLLRAVSASAIVTVLLFGVLFLTGRITDLSLLSHYATGELRMRHSLGFNNPNAGAIIFSGLLFIPLIMPRKKAVAFFICVFIIVAVCFYTGTRSVPATVALYTGAMVFFRRLILAGKCKQCSVIALIIAIIVFALSFVLPLFAGTSVDLALSNRASIINNLLSEMSVIDYLIGSSSFSAIDNSYLFALFSGGILLTTILFFEICRALWFAAIAKDYYAVSLFLSLMVFGLFEGSLFRPELAICIGFWSLVFFYNNQSFMKKTATTQL